MRVNIYRDLKMHYKLFLQYLLLLAIPFTLFIIVNYRISSKDLETQARYSSRQVFEQSRSFMEFKLYVAKNFLTILASNEKIQDILHRSASYYYNSYGLWSFDVEGIRKQFYITKPSEDIIKTSLYTSQAVASTNETDDVMSTNRIASTAWYANLNKSSTTFEVFPSMILLNDLQKEKTPTFTIARSIFDNESFQNVIGVLSVDMPKSIFESILDRVAFTKESSVFLINQAGEILVHSSHANAGMLSFKSDILKGSTNDQFKEGVWGKRVFDNAEYLVGAQLVEDSDWYLVSLTPYKEILGSQKKAMKQMLAIAFLIAMFLLPLAFLAAASGTRRIRGLISQMKSVKQGDFDLQIQHEGKDEIGELSRNFKSMIAKVTQLLDEKYALGQEVKSMELKALQAQINPHFLYNTLDLIYWKAMRIQEQGIYDLVQSLSKFYKLSLSKGEDIVSLRNEVEHIAAYIDIQNARFKNGITLVIDIPEALYEHAMPKITLQPLVENSIIHGILETESETGTITISANAVHGKIVITVKDDGVGISQENLERIFNRDRTDPFHGYGANNINKRIKLLYGEEYGLTYRRNEGPGVTVIIELPW
ncbi:cache domain-containing sensor histidine kinase [Paenibacillus lignilyticus]|uniref:histidine kinase n=1 Tax=Paenibacillus lignilyticus TaxID=1172615 RepID=A0ABS5C7A9_9BACL|nr:sensor histidine kinase [Paenibacillus lignilyticus]MBP3961788.1 sensor histidine kinase [Paenibacillus lignilyticus]MBP3963541.1 sensor histidine kinase [Paenibacillus lignilyticus]